MNTHNNLWFDTVTQTPNHRPWLIAISNWFTYSVCRDNHICSNAVKPIDDFCFVHKWDCTKLEAILRFSNESSTTNELLTVQIAINFQRQITFTFPFNYTDFVTIDSGFGALLPTMFSFESLSPICFFSQSFVWTGTGCRRWLDCIYKFFKFHNLQLFEYHRSSFRVAGLLKISKFLKYRGWRGRCVDVFYATLCPAWTMSFAKNSHNFCFFHVDRGVVPKF